MTTLQGIITKSIDNANVQFESLGFVTTNVANYNTVGYKKQSFENYLKDNGKIEGTLRTDYAAGMLYATRKPLDIAVDGAGFIPVTTKDGAFVYTRDGSLTTNSQGYLVTQDGCIVGDGVKVPTNYYKLKIMGDGSVTVIDERDVEPRTIGKIPLVVFNAPERLESIGNNKLARTRESGNPMLVSDHQRIKQGNLERSNVNIFASVEEVLRINASMISSIRLIKVTDELYRQSINLRQ